MSLYFGYEQTSDAERDVVVLKDGKVNKPIDMGKFKITQSSAPTEDSDLANKEFVDKVTATVLASTVSVITTTTDIGKNIVYGTSKGNIDMNGNQISGLPVPTNGGHAINRTYANLTYEPKRTLNHICTVTWHYAGTGGDPKPLLTGYTTEMVPIKRSSIIRLLTHTFDFDNLMGSGSSTNHYLNYIHKNGFVKKNLGPVAYDLAMNIGPGKVYNVYPLNKDIDLSTILLASDPDPIVGYISTDQVTSGGNESALLVSILNKI